MRVTKMLTATGLALIAIAFALLPLAATAADLPSRVAPVAPVYTAFQAPLFSGFYAGVNGSYVFKGDTRYSVDGDEVLTQNAKGFLGGIHAGYDLRFGNIVVGVEGAGSLGSVNKDGTIYGVAKAGTKINALYAATGRVGYVVGPILVYGKGGFAAANVKSSLDVGLSNWNAGKLHTGWTVGGGVEYAFAQNWSVGAEYNYYRLSEAGHTANAFGYPLTVNAKPELHEGRLNVNYRF